MHRARRSCKPCQPPVGRLDIFTPTVSISRVPSNTESAIIVVSTANGMRGIEIERLRVLAASGDMPIDEAQERILALQSATFYMQCSTRVVVKVPEPYRVHGEAALRVLREAADSQQHLRGKYEALPFSCSAGGMVCWQ